MKKIFALFTVILFVVPSLAFAIPDLPHQFYGTVTVNGAPSANGTKVEAKIDSTVVVSKITTDGKYGYNPNVFMVTDPDGTRSGKSIAFFVDGVDTGKTVSFSRGTLTKLDLNVTTSTGSPGGGGPSGGSPNTQSPSSGGPTLNPTPPTNNPSLPPTPPAIPDTPQIPAPSEPQGRVLGEKITNTATRITEVMAREKARVKKADIKLTQRLVGRILLQTQEKGEAWYIPVGKTTRYYLADGPSAFKLLRNEGLGISNSDIAKIPVGIEKRFKDVDTDKDGLFDTLEEGLKTDPKKADTDGDGISDGDEILTRQTNPLGTGAQKIDTRLAGKMKGRILLQVQSKGEAWYINPVDGKRYYMKSGDAAFQIMRYLSLGVSNTDIAKIDVGEVE